MNRPIVIGSIVGAGLIASARDRHDADDDAEGIADAETADGPAPAGATSTADATRAWVWPLPTWRGYPAVISDGLGSPRDGGARSHHGVDLDYRAPSKDSLPEFKRGTADRSTGGLFFAPAGVPVLAAADGVIWGVSLSSRGYQITIDHGKPWATYYQHLASVRFPDLKRGAGGIRVHGGEPIGIMGNGHNPGQAAPTAFRHLHFEMWKAGGPAAFVDPAPYLRTARRVALSSELAAIARSKRT